MDELWCMTHNLRGYSLCFKWEPCPTAFVWFVWLCKCNWRLLQSAICCNTDTSIMYYSLFYYDLHFVIKILWFHKSWLFIDSTMPFYHVLAWLPVGLELIIDLDCYILDHRILTTCTLVLRVMTACRLWHTITTQDDLSNNWDFTPSLCWEQALSISCPQTICSGNKIIPARSSPFTSLIL